MATKRFRLLFATVTATFVMMVVILQFVSGARSMHDVSSAQGGLIIFSYLVAIAGFYRFMR